MVALLIPELQESRFFSYFLLLWFPQVELVGKKVYAAKKVPENHKIHRHLLKTDIKSSLKLV